MHPDTLTGLCLIAMAALMGGYCRMLFLWARDDIEKDRRDAANQNPPP